MKKFESLNLDALPERALLLANRVGDEFRHVMPDGAGKWLQTGVALGALKTGGRIAGGFVRRNPAAVAAAAAGAGILWLLARRRARRAENGAIEGTSTRVEARRSNGKAGAGRARTARKPRVSRRSKASTTE